MKKILVAFFLGTVVSGYLFPFSFTFLPPSLNTKQMLAVLGLAFYGMECLRSHTITLPRDLFVVAIIACVFSGSCYLSAVLNGTDDMTYATYFRSFAIWVMGAYAVCTIFRWWYGSVSLHRLTVYMVWVCVAQCVLALMIDNIPAFQQFVDRYIEQTQWFLHEVNRMYGIGASLDNAGVRFAVVLVLLAHELCTHLFVEGEKGPMILYLFAFFFIVLVGDMISRTTIVGAGMGLAYIALYLLRVEKGVIKAEQLRVFWIITILLAITLPIVTYLYNTNEEMHSNLRFAFEGFFNWRETGVWRTDSTDKLNGVMWVWPKDFRTWLIGSGKFAHFIYSTDIGYCRFVLYCGLIGFSIFCFYFVYNAWIFSRKYENTGLLPLMLLALTFVIWIKVATDIFTIYALFLCADAEEDSLDMDNN